MNIPSRNCRTPVDVIAWAAAQPWCSGKVGMMGISWGGFNALQVAAKQPPALKAIVTLCSTDDRYADDIHYKGGLLLNENMGWGATMLSYSSRPPDPAIVGESWREMWLDRLEHEPFLPAVWLKHQRRDAYWKRGSVCEDFSRIKAATLAIGGWGDAYKNAVSRLVGGIAAPVKGIVGPWIHKYPHFAVPKPAIGFLQEALRWWDRWLKDIDTGVENDPAMRLYLMDSVPPRDWYEERPGRWIALDDWPSDRDRSHDAAARLATRRCARGRAGIAGRNRLAAGLRHGGRRILRDLARSRTAGRPARRRREIALLRRRHSRRRARHRRRADRAPEAVGRSAEAPWSPCGCATSSPTAPRPASPTACSTFATATATKPPKRSRPAR